MRKKYKYVVYYSIVFEDEWSFNSVEKEFKVKNDAVEYLLERAAEEIDKYNLDLDEAEVDGLTFINHKTNSYISLRTQEI